MIETTVKCLMIFALGAPASAAQDADRPSPEELLAAKLQSPFLDKADWVLDFDAAMKKARDGKKPILGYFTTAGY